MSYEDFLQTEGATVALAARMCRQESNTLHGCLRHLPETPEFAHTRTSVRIAAEFLESLETLFDAMPHEYVYSEKEGATRYQLKLGQVIAEIQQRYGVLCPAVIFHGPGHQSKTRCSIRGTHDEHYAILHGDHEGEFQWVGDERIFASSMGDRRR